MPRHYDIGWMNTSTVGTGTMTLTTAVSPWLTFANAGVQSGDVLWYGIIDGSNSEVGFGTYTVAGTTTLTRNVYKSTNSNALISLSGSAQVYIAHLAADGGDMLLGTNNPLRGFDMPINLQLNASVASNLLTIALKGNNGADPSNTNPVLIPFRDATSANGDPVWRTVTAALSVATSATGSNGSFGTSSSVPFRLWVVALDNGGTVELALWQSTTGGASPTAIAPLDETSVQSTTAISTATSAGVFYSTTARTSKSIRIIGYVEYNTGLATAGSYNIVPTKIQLFGPGVMLPNDIVQTIFSSTTTGDGVGTTSTTYVATAFTGVISVTSAVNKVLVSCSTTVLLSGANSGVASVFRGSTEVTNNIFCGAGVSAISSGTMMGLDFPAAAGSTTYTLEKRTTANTSTVFCPEAAGGEVCATMVLQEIQS